jgi:hypothetical protein
MCVSTFVLAGLFQNVIHDSKSGACVRINLPEFDFVRACLARSNDGHVQISFWCAHVRLNKLTKNDAWRCHTADNWNLEEQSEQSHSACDMPEHKRPFLGAFGLLMSHSEELFPSWNETLSGPHVTISGSRQHSSPFSCWFLPSARSTLHSVNRLPHVPIYG